MSHDKTEGQCKYCINLLLLDESTMLFDCDFEYFIQIDLKTLEDLHCDFFKCPEWEDIRLLNKDYQHLI